MIGPPHRLDLYDRQRASPGTPGGSAPVSSDPALPRPLLAAAALLVEHVRVVHDGLVPAATAGAKRG